MDMNQGTKLITADSALRHVPIDVPSKDKVMLDGVRYSIEIADRAHRRLRETLWIVSSKSEEDQVDRYVDMVSDAWTIVDSIHRLRVLCEANSRLFNSGYCREYAEVTKDVVLLRNSVQHMHSKLEKLVADKESAWGVLSWIVCTENPPSKAEKHSFSAGTMRANDVLLPEFPERPFYPPVDGISLRAAKTTISLSDLMLVTGQLAAAFDEDLKKAFPRDAPHIRDAHAVAHISFNGCGVPAGNIRIVFKQVEASRMNREQRRAMRK